MAGITLEQAQQQLDAFLAASIAVSKGQEYAIGDRSLKRADLTEINAAIAMWQSQVERLSAGGRGRGIRIRGGVPL